jgi:pectate lyase
LSQSDYCIRGYREVGLYRRNTGTAATLLLGVLLVCASQAGARPLQGFGADTVGGAGGESYVVTSLADSGPGTFRDAVSASNREISFAVGGTIGLESTVRVTGHHLTIDASTAPSPGITITAAHAGVLGALFDIRGANDMIVRHIRVIDAPDPEAGDNLRIWDGACNIVIDHCSFRRAGDGNVDICIDAHDITIQWSIIADTVKNSLIRTGLTNISLHHNLFILGNERNPQLDDATSVDMVNNVIYGWATNYGTRIRNGASANLVKNYYIPAPGSDASDAVVIEPDAGAVYMEGNIIPPSCPTSGTTQTRMDAPPVTEMSPIEALEAVLEEAGAHPHDADDEDYLSGVVSSPVEPTSWGQIKSMYRSG